MNLDELRTVQSTERQKDSLQNLRPSFYRDVGEYIAELEDERDRLAAEVEDPFASPEVRRLTDEIETAKDVVRAVYERRMGKLVKQASLAAAGMPADDEGLTAEERELFSDLVDRIETNTNRVLDVLDGDGDGPSIEPGGTPESTPTNVETDDPLERSPDEPRPAHADPPDEAIDAADVMGGERPPARSNDPPTDESRPGDESASSVDDTSSDAADPRKTVDRLTVRITTDLGPILGVDDREYTLSRDDVVTLPEQNAVPLVERGAAEPVE